LARYLLVPQSLDERIYCAPHLSTQWCGLGTILRQQIVEQNNVCCELLDLSDSCVERSLRASHEQSNNEHGSCCNEACTKTYDVLCFLTEMMVWQQAAKTDASEDA